jgi:hypothetical protein
MKKPLLFWMLYLGYLNAFAGPGADKYALDPDGSTSLVFPIFLVVGLIIFFLFAFVRDFFRGDASPTQANFGKSKFIPIHGFRAKPPQELVEVAHSIFSMDMYLCIIGATSDEIINSYYTNENVNKWRAPMKFNTNSHGLDCISFCHDQAGAIEVILKNDKAFECTIKHERGLAHKTLTDKGIIGGVLSWEDVENKILFTLSIKAGYYYLKGETKNHGISRFVK